VIKRWPVIITSVIDIVHQKCHELSLQINEIDQHPGNQIEELQERITEGTDVIEKVSKLKYNMARDRTMEYVDSAQVVGYDSCVDHLLVQDNTRGWRIRRQCVQ
jgi:hypothetical protein